MKTAGEENPNSQVRLYNEPRPWDGKSEPSLLIHRGWKGRKNPAAGGVFFLTFPFIELHGTRQQSCWKLSTVRGGMSGSMSLSTFRAITSSPTIYRRCSQMGNRH